MLACMVFAAVAGTAIFALISNASLTEAKRDLAIAASAVTIIAGVIGIGSKVWGGLQLLWRRRDRSRLIRAHLIDRDRLVDRSDEMKDLIDALTRSREVNCWGEKGAGKSFLLKHLADVINGYRNKNFDHPKTEQVAAALYFDLAEAVGFSGIEERICREVLGKEHGTWHDFTAYVTKKFPRRRVLLILDNANTQALWPAVGRVAYEYLAQRPEDRLVFGSVKRMSLINIVPKPVAVEGLDLSSTAEMVANKDISIDPQDLQELHAQFKGLPYYVGLFARIGASPHGAKEAADRETMVDVELIPTLGPQTRQLLAYASLFAMVTRQISLYDLEQCHLVDLDSQLKEDEALLTPLADHQREFGIHDVLRDSVLRTVEPEVSGAALHLFLRAQRQGRQGDAALFAMFADPRAVGADAFDGVLEPVIRKAVDSRDYAVLDGLHSRASQRPRVRQFIAEDRNRHDLFSWGRATLLAGLGQYGEAEAELLSTGALSTTGTHARSSDLDPSIRFLLADIAHLQNRYDDAAQMFEDLGNWAWSAGQKKLHARCTWGQGHVLRHQGKDLDGALDLFERAIDLGSEAGELFARAYSITGATGIRVFREDVPADEEHILFCIETQIAAATTHDSYMLEVWKSQAQVAWLRGDSQRAFEIVESAIEKALEQNDRLLYNLYFEKAEFLRLSGCAKGSLTFYRQVLKFGEGNGDRNLISNALLGLVLADLAADCWVHHASAEKAHDACLRARRVALDADIQITGKIARQIATMFDEPEGATKRQRLILF
ncbi:MAG TPA: hypothetical protein VG898_06200 [Solirubrobacterales bacterium]|nr:hypothetical protein [Solirubrobacterales bacterium]